MISSTPDMLVDTAAGRTGSFARMYARSTPMFPSVLVVTGLTTMFLGAIPRWGDLRTFVYLTDGLLMLTIFAPIILMLGFYLQLRLLLSDDHSALKGVMSTISAYGADHLESKLETLDGGLSLCRQADSKTRPIFLLASVLLAYGVCFTGLLLARITNAVLDGAPGIFVGILAFEAPPLALLAGTVILFWYSYQASRVSGIRKYIMDERAAVVGKKRILDRFEDRHTEFVSLTEQVADLIRVNECGAAADSRKNGLLVLSGVVLSALISIVGILGSANLLHIGSTNLDGNVVSAILGVIVAATITVQSSFRLAERARFQRRVASDARRLMVELVFNVDTDEKLSEVVREYQRLTDDSVRNLPTLRAPESTTEQTDDDAPEAKAPAAH